MLKMNLENYPIPSTVLGKDITDLLFAIFHHYGCMSSSKVFDTLATMCSQAADNICDEKKILSFLKSYPRVFNVDSSGYVSTVEKESALDLNISSKEGEVAAWLQVYFQDDCKVHYNVLPNCFKDFCCRMEAFFANLSSTQQVDYFKNSPSFTVLSNGDVEAIFMRRTNVDYVQRKLGERNYTWPDEMYKIIQNKLKSRSCHYMELMNWLADPQLFPKIVIDYIQELSALEKFWFFRNRRAHYYISSDGQVKLNHYVKRSITKFFQTRLKENGKVHYLQLIEMLRDSSSCYSDYFAACSKKLQLEFFTLQPKQFTVSRDLYVEVAGR